MSVSLRFIGEAGELLRLEWWHWADPSRHGPVVPHILAGLGLLARADCSPLGMLSLLTEAPVDPAAGATTMLSGERLVYPGFGMASCCRKLVVLIADELQTFSSPVVVTPPPTRALLFKPPVREIKEKWDICYDIQGIRQMKSTVDWNIALHNAMRCSVENDAAPSAL